MEHANEMLKLKGAMRCAHVGMIRHIDRPIMRYLGPDQTQATAFSSYEVGEDGKYSEQGHKDT